ncbi:TPA: phosphohydrolase [Candidatus Sumerlaeota bacterium]|nr:phosphohydrolase [Candidatus Sumerlaeota bacterium]
MFPAQIDHITATLYQRLSPGRVLHCIGTAHAAVTLALRWSANAEDALVAALLHDIAKQEPEDVLRRLMQESGASLTDEAPFQKVWHAAAGALIARRDFGASEEAARAILLHPTGDAGMSVLEQIIFLADYIEPSRAWDGVNDIRALARQDLQAAVHDATKRKTAHVRERGTELHPRSCRALAEAEEQAIGIRQ